MTKGNHASDERYRQEGVEGAVEDVPEAHVISANLPELGDLVEHESSSHDIEHPFHNVQVTATIDCVDCNRIKYQKQQTEKDLDGILVLGCAHPVGVKMRRVVCICFVLIWNE